MKIERALGTPDKQKKRWSQTLLLVTGDLIATGDPPDPVEEVDCIVGVPPQLVDLAPVCKYPGEEEEEEDASGGSKRRIS